MNWLLVLGWSCAILMLVCSFIAWCCVRVGAKADQAISEEELDYACECALNVELADHSFVRGK